MKTKNELRKHFLELRRNIDTEQAIHDTLVHFQEWMRQSRFHCVGSYKPLMKWTEMNLNPFENIIINHNPEAVICYPTVMSDEMSFYQENEESFWKNNSWGVSEIHDGRLIQPEDLDLILCPLIVCDRHGYRLGYGKGFYDRYLKKLGAQCVKVGLGYFDVVGEIPETFEADVPLDVYISPFGIHEF